MSDFKILRDKKAQLSDAMVWIIATLIIIVIMVIFFYASSGLNTIKKIGVDSEGVFSGLVNEEGKGGEWIETKNSLAFEKNSENKIVIESWLNQKGD